MIDLGMDSTAEIVTPPDVIELAWKRYDEAATAEDNAWYAYSCRPVGWTRQSKEAKDLYQGAHDAQAKTNSCRTDKNILTGDECSCDGSSSIPCDYCHAYANVMAWYREQK